MCGKSGQAIQPSVFRLWLSLRAIEKKKTPRRRRETRKTMTLHARQVDTIPSEEPKGLCFLWPPFPCLCIRDDAWRACWRLRAAHRRRPIDQRIGEAIARWPPARFPSFFLFLIHSYAPTFSHTIHSTQARPSARHVAFSEEEGAAGQQGEREGSTDGFGRMAAGRARGTRGRWTK